MLQKIHDLPETRRRQTAPFYHGDIKVFGEFYFKGVKETFEKSYRGL